MAHVVTLIDTTAATAVTQCVRSVTHFKCFNNTGSSRLENFDTFTTKKWLLLSQSLIGRSNPELPI